MNSIFKLFSKNHNPEPILKDNQVLVESISLNQMVEEYLKWYKSYLEENDYSVFHEQPRMTNFIEKIAVWYELAYPDNLVVDIIKNMYKNPDFKAKSLFPKQDFYKRLSGEEQFLLENSDYPSIVYIDSRKFLTHFHLSKYGFITEVDELSDLDKVNDIVVPPSSSFIDKHITEILPFLKKNNLLPEKNEIEDAINNHMREQKCLEGMLNSAMYRIIERGGNRIGPYRAFLFALEFKLNIEIPIKYSYDPADPNLRLLINEYFKAGGKEDITCYELYFFRNSDEQIINTILLEELYPELWLNCVSKYTEEENNLHQKLVNTIKRYATNKQSQELKLERKKDIESN